VVEVEVVSAAAGDAPPVVSFPHGKLDLGRDDPIMFQILWYVAQFGVGVVDELELECEHPASVRFLLPRVYETKDAIERPNIRLIFS